MIDKIPNLQDVLGKVFKSLTDRKLRELLFEVAKSIGSKPKMEIGISKSDQESIVFTSPQGRPICTTLGRLMTRHLGYDPKKYSLAIQVLTDAYIAEVRRANVSFDVVQGEGIVEAYKVEWGAHSCMTGKDSKYTEFVEENEDVISMLLFKDKTTKARALLWNTVEGDRVLDRIYPNSGWHIDVIKKWAAGLGIITRDSQSFPSGGCIALSNKKRYTAKVHNENGVWSYMDTFTFGKCISKGNYEFLLSNSHKLIDSAFCLQTTDGEQNEWLKCARCHESIGPDGRSAEVYLDRKDEHPKYWCYDCIDEFAFICLQCGRKIVRKGKETLCDYCTAMLKQRKEEEQAQLANQPIPVAASWEPYVSSPSNAITYTSTGTDATF